MKKIVRLMFLVTILSLVMNSCGVNSITEGTTSIEIPAVISKTSTSTTIPVGKTLVITSAKDSGLGTLRQALQDAQPGDIITFDSGIFNPEEPVTIELKSGLPPISQGYLTIDASNAGVILDGSQTSGDWTVGIEITSGHNIVQGLQVVHFSGYGIMLDSTAQFNTIGGDRNIGVGPLGQGNLFSDSSDGVGIRGSDNLIVGNLIGTDVTGSMIMGNRAPGIFLEENASRNVIGPDNIIAFNGTVGGGGVEIRSVNAQGNSITANSIHDNSSAGIFYSIDSSPQLEKPNTPIILHFDLTSGKVGGVSCPGCVVEVFSTSSVDGEIYEGSATTDNNGYFSLEKGKAFAGPNLTATSRSSKSNTSEFSVPTSGNRRVLLLQNGNKSSLTILESKLSNELEDNRIGQTYSSLYLIQGLQNNLNSEVIALGTKFVKLTITEAEPVTLMGSTEASVRWDISEFSFAPDQEAFITNMAENALKVDYMLNFWDKANHPQGWQPVVSRFKTQDEIDRYLEYVRFIVRHFKGRVTYYEIWNEPSNDPPLQWIQSADYINLVKQTVPIIRAEDPDAKIVVGGVALVNPGGIDYLFDLLNSDIISLVDVVSWHPFYGQSPENESEYYYGYSSLVEQFKAVAASHGFRGEFRAEEVSYGSPNSYGGYLGNMIYSNIAAAKYSARGLIANLGMNVGVGIGGSSSFRTELFTVTQNICTLMAGAQAMEIPVEIQSEAMKVKSYGFSMTNGDKLLAIWSDGVAVDDDPGVSATVTLPGFSGWTATGIDALYDYEQELITTSENGNLVIENFLIKDYPIIIRLSK